MKWVYTTECKTLSDDEVHASTDLKESLDRPIQEVWQALNACDSDCPNLHFTKRVNKIIDPLVCSDDGECHSVNEIEIGVDCQGHSLVCSNDGESKSTVPSRKRDLYGISAHPPFLAQFPAEV
jgi:hypothetical protein